MKEKWFRDRRLFIFDVIRCYIKYYFYRRLSLQRDCEGITLYIHYLSLIRNFIIAWSRDVDHSERRKKNVPQRKERIIDQASIGVEVQRRRVVWTESNYGYGLVTQKCSASRKLFRVFRRFNSVPLNSPSRQTNEIRFPVSFEVKRAVDFLSFSPVLVFLTFKTSMWWNRTRGRLTLALFNITLS